MDPILESTLDNSKRCSLPSCNKVLVPRRWEYPKKFRERLTCNFRCSRGYLSWKAAQRPPARQKCKREGCDVYRVQRKNQSIGHFKASKFCADHRYPDRVEGPPRQCEACPNKFYRHSNETEARFEVRRTCGKSCANKLPRGHSKPPQHKCALAKCDVMIPEKSKYCSRDHCAEDRKVPEEIRKAKAKATRDRYNEKRPKRPKRIAQPKKPKEKKVRSRRDGESRIVRHKSLEPKPPPRGFTVFGDREPTEVWRPAAFGGPIPKEEVRSGTPH